MQQYYSLKDIAEKLGVNERTIYRHVREGRISHNRIGGLIRVSENDLAKFLRRTKREENGEEEKAGRAGSGTVCEG